MAEELSGLRSAIQQELELARRGEGYEEKAVADEIVERFVLPLLAPMRAKHYTPYVDEEHQGGYCFDFFAPTLGRMARAERERDLLLWLHAELAEEKAAAADWSTIDRLSLDQVLSERDAAEASRKDWAAEAQRLEMAVEAARCTGARDCHSDVHHEGCFYSDSEFCCDDPRPMGDAGEPDENVISCANCGEDMAPDMLERLASRPVCAVHPEGGGRA